MDILGRGAQRDILHGRYCPADCIQGTKVEEEVE